MAFSVGFCVFFMTVIQSVGEHIKVRQQVIATATVYFKRFYARQVLADIAGSHV